MQQELLEILFNTKAKTHIAKLIININININIYIPGSLLLINIVSKEATLLSFSKRIIIYTIDTKEKIYILNFNKVQYLLNYSINIFKVRKLLNRGEIQIKNGNLIINKEGFSIFQFKKNIVIIEVFIKNRIAQLLKVKFNKRGPIIKSLLKEDNTDILILIQARNRGKSTKN